MGREVYMRPRNESRRGEGGWKARMNGVVIFLSLRGCLQLLISVRTQRQESI